MGNSACCEGNSNDKGQVVMDDFTPVDAVPTVHPNIQNYLDTKKPFKKQLKANKEKEVVKRKYGDEVYEGPLNIFGKPGGVGKMYKKDGSLYVGEFTNGAASGWGHYIRPDGTYYEGDMTHNQATTKKGIYQGPDFRYEGAMVNNVFHGHGREEGQDYTYEGEYEKGKKTNGKLTWGKGDNIYSYEGAFDSQNKFTGKGKLIEGLKGEYEGDFLNGQKHGQGTYSYRTGIKYVGSYQNGLKNGSGILYNDDKTISYEGDFKDGLPHGVGTATGKDGQKVRSEWVGGLDRKAHEELQNSKIK